MATAKSNRKSVQAIVKETTAGTPVDPSSGADFITLREGFDVTPNIEEIANDELSSNVDTKAPILGVESPTSSISHYFRHSGVEATAPIYDVLLEAALGATDAAHTERLTTSGSTSGDVNSRAVVKIASGGSDFERGRAILLKDTTNGYLVRNVYSVSGDDLTMLFNLGQTAPATGLGTGRSILYKTADEPTAVTHHMYRGNGAGYEVITGGQVTSMTLNAPVGEPLGIDFEIGGTGYYFNPLRVDSDDRYLDFDLGASEVSVSVTSKLYKSPLELASALETAVSDAGVTGTFSVDYNNTGSDAGKFTISHSGGTLNLLWNTGSNAANTVGDLLGFSVAADDTGASSYTSDTVQDWSAPYTQTQDSDINPLIVKNNEVLIGTFDQTACVGVQDFTLSVASEYVDVKSACAESGISEKILRSRTTTVTFNATLKQHDAKSFEQYRLGDTVQFAYTGGTKTGGNWVAGKCVNVCIVEAKISQWKLDAIDDVVVVSATLTLSGNSSGEQNLFVNLL